MLANPSLERTQPQRENQMKEGLLRRSARGRYTSHLFEEFFLLLLIYYKEIERFSYKK